MKRIISLIILVVLSAPTALHAQADYKSRGLAAVSRGDYKDAKNQFEAAKAVLQSQKVNPNAPEFIDIEKMIAYAEQCRTNRANAVSYLDKLEDSKLQSAFAECSTEDDAEQLKMSMLANLSKAKESLISVVNRFPSDRVSKSQLSDCDGIELKIVSMRNGFAEVLAWKKASEENTVASYEAFLSEYLSGNYASAAYSRIRDIKDDNAWTEAERLNSRSGYNSYLAAFGDGKYAKTAAERAYTMGEREDWDTAKSENTVYAYQQFISQYPNSQYQTDAKQKLSLAEERVFWEEQSAANTVVSYQTYMRKYPQGQYVSTAKNRIDKISEAEVWRKVESVNTIEAYEKYLSSSKIKAYKDDAEQRIADIKHEREVDADNKRWDKIKNSTNQHDFTAYLNASGYKGHIEEAKGREKLLQARNLQLTSASADKVISAYDSAKVYVDLESTDIERLDRARNMYAEQMAFEAFNKNKSLSTANAYLSMYKDGSHYNDVSDYIAEYMAGQMTVNVTEDEYNNALSYAKTSRARAIVTNTYDTKVKERKKMKREPFHVLFGIQGEVLTSTEFKEFGYDYGLLFSLGGHSNRMNLELGYNIGSSSLVIRPKLNMVKKNYKGLLPAVSRKGSEYSKFYLYLAPEVKYSFKSKISEDVSDDVALAVEDDSTVKPAISQKLDYGARLGIGVGWFDISAGYMFVNKQVTLGIALYFGNK